MNEHTDSSSDRELTTEMTPRLSETDYEVKVKVLAERMLRELANDTGVLTPFDTTDVRTLLSETVTIYENFPFSILEHGQHKPRADVWPWIDDAVPKESLRRQALGILAGDVFKRLNQFAQSKKYTYRQDGATYVRKTVNQTEAGNTAQEADTSNNSTASRRDGYRSTDSPNENPAVDERAPGWELPTDGEGEPDYEATIEQIGLEYDQLFNIDTDYYRYRGRRGDDIMVAPQSEYADLADDAFAIPFVWAAYCEGRIGHGAPVTGPGMVRGISNASGDSFVKLQPSDRNSADSFTRIGLNGVPERGAFFVDYSYGEDLPALTLYDATDREQPAYQFLLPTREHPTVQMVRDSTSHLLAKLPTELRERIESEHGHEHEHGSKDEDKKPDQ
jgi:hypothetical protein